MIQATTENIIREILTTEFDLTSDQIKLESKLKDDLNINSLERSLLSLEMEVAFGVVIYQKDVELIETVGELVDYINFLLPDPSSVYY